MKKEELLEKMELIEDEYIEEAAPEEKQEQAERKNRVLRILIPAALLSAAAVAVFFITRNFFPTIRPETPYETRHVTPDPGAARPENETMPERRWEDLEVYEKFTAFSLDGRQYEACFTRIADELAGESLGPVHFSTQDWNGDPFEDDGEIFTIRGMDRAYALAVRYVDAEGLYSFINYREEPGTLADFSRAIDIPGRLTSTGSAMYNYLDRNGKYHPITFEGLTTAFVQKEILEACQDAPYVPGFDPGFSQMSVGVSIPELGSSNVCFRITEDGHLWTNLLRACFGFNIGEERAKALIEKINENYTGVELIYDEPAPGTAAENEEGAAGDGAQDDGIVIEYTSGAAAPDAAGEEILSE